MEGELPLAVITGVTGFQGIWVCKKFLEHGGFRVRGTVRSLTNPAKIEPLKKAFGEHFDSLELVEANLTDDASLCKAVEGATYVIHTASPVHMDASKLKDPELEMVRPAVDGTMSIMRASKAGGVKRVVITSSIAAVMDTTIRHKNHYGVEDWNINHQDPYGKSKSLAEKAAWDFSKAEGIELVTICPGMI